MRSEKFQTIHPQGFKSPRIDKAKYDFIRAAIIAVLQAHGTMGFMDALNLVHARHKDEFEGVIAWYFTTVKLDMEARGELARVPGKGVQKIKLS